MTEPSNPVFQGTRDEAGVRERAFRPNSDVSLTSALVNAGKWSVPLRLFSKIQGLEFYFQFCSRQLRVSLNSIVA